MKIADVTIELATVLSIIAIIISITSAWFTLFHKGTVKMTKPSLVALFANEGLKPNSPKVFLRTLLYTTGKRGHAIETMFIKIRFGDDIQRFMYWTYGERHLLVPGSGMFVGPEGNEVNHHFTPHDSSSYIFKSGSYTIEVYGKIAGSKKHNLLEIISFSLDTDHEEALKTYPDVAIFLWWDAEKELYDPRIDRRPKKANL